MQLSTWYLSRCPFLKERCIVLAILFWFQDEEWKKKMETQHFEKTLKAFDSVGLFAATESRRQYSVSPFNICRKSLRRNVAQLGPLLFKYYAPTESNPFLILFCTDTIMLTKDCEVLSSDLIRLAGKSARRRLRVSLFILSLMLTSDSNDRIALSRRVLSAGFNPNERTNKAGFTALKNILTSNFPNKYDFFESLLCFVTELNPLVLAVYLNDFKLVNYLIQMGSNIALVLIV